MKPRPQKQQGIATRVGIGALIGTLGGALLLSIGVARAVLAKVPIPAEDEPLLGLYVLSATASGALGGALFPFAKRRLGAVLVGLVAIQPFMLGCMFIAEDEPTSWTERIVISGIMTAIFGPILGLKWIRTWHSDAN